MPSMAKLSSYLAADEYDESEVQETLKALKEHQVRVRVGVRVRVRVRTRVRVRVGLGLANPNPNITP